MCLAALAVPSVVMGEASFQGLGILDDAASPAGSFAFGVSADGQFVVGTSFIAGAEGNETRAVRWSARAGLVNLGVPPDSLGSSMGLRISDDGLTVAGGVGFAIGDAFEIRNAAFFAGVRPVHAVLVAEGLVCADVTADGSILVGATRVPAPWPIIDQAFRMDKNGAPQELGLLPGGSYSSAAAVSADGAVIVGFGDTPDHIVAFRWTQAEGIHLLDGQPTGVPTQANAVAPDGSIVVGVYGNQVFRWTEAQGFDVLENGAGIDFANASDVNADGSVIVGMSMSKSGDEAFVWDPVVGMRNLSEALTAAGADVAGWTLGWATGVSDDGRTIVGMGVNPEGLKEGFIATLPRTGDLNDDGTIDGADLGLLLGAWGACRGSCGDINLDGQVDGADLGLLLAAWST